MVQKYKCFNRIINRYHCIIQDLATVVQLRYFLPGNEDNPAAQPMLADLAAVCGGLPLNCRKIRPVAEDASSVSGVCLRRLPD
jgi:hypothetical protein